MAATVVVNRLTGVGPTATNIKSINTVANAQDTHEATASTSSNPIKIPAAGTNYSYWVVTRLETTVGPTGTVNNLRWHTDGSNNFGTGVGCNVQTATGYVQATGTVGETGTILNTANYGTLAAAPADCFARTSGSPLSVTGSTTTTGQFGDRVVYQLTVGTGASAGTTGQETFTWLYDET
jgi:hypothetical protein